MLGSSGIVLVLNGVTAIISARVLGPEAFAAWGVVALIGGYAVWSQMGAFNGMNREIPRLTAQGRHDEVLQIQGGALAVGGLTALVLAAVLIGSGLIMRAVGSPMWIAVAISAPFVIVRQAWVYLGTLYRAEQEFAFVAEFQLVSAVVSTGISIPLVLSHGFAGFVTGQIIAYVLSCGYGLWRRPRAVVLAAPTIAQVQALLRIGLPIWLSGVMNELAASVDRIVGLVLLSPVAYGMYSLTPFLRQSVGLPARSLAEVVYPRLSQNMGELDGQQSMRALLVRQDVVLAFAMPLFLGLVYVSLPTLLPLALPEYASGVEMLGIYSLSLAWWSLFAAGSALNATGRGRSYAVILALTAVVSGVAALSLSALVPASLALPMGVTLAGITGSLTTVWAAHRAVGASSAEASSHTVGLTVPIVLLTVAALIIGHAVDGASALALLGRIGLFCIAGIPVMLFGEWRFGAVRMVNESLRRLTSA